jgi:5-methylcytosine-specific restriction endonuclease McrA
LINLTPYRKPIFTTLTPEDYQARINGQIRTKRQSRIPITRKQRLEMIEQVNNICEGCNQYYQSRILEIHHIDHDPANNDPENLIVYCLNCHKQADKEECQ